MLGVMKISRRHFLETTIALSACGLLSKFVPAIDLGGRNQKHPNLIVVFPDQMRGQALGFLNEDPVVTPRLDRFAADSLVLPQAVSNRPVCSPFRAMLMTGKYPHANHVICNCTNETEPYGCELQKSDRCWSDVLKDKGYNLGYIGKWHLDSPRKPYIDCANNKGAVKWEEWCSPDRRHGFDFWYAYGTYDMHLKPMYWTTEAPRDGFHYVDQWSPEHEADQAIKYINNEGGKYRRPDQPFALVVSMNPPHTPYNAFPAKYLKAYEGKSAKDLLVRPNVETTGKTESSRLALEQTRNYFANITGVDEQFGRILDAIKAAGLDENTIVVFTSDHGNCLGTHNEKTKICPFEESMRIPFLVRWPGKIKPRRDDLLMSVPDIFPTLLELMGFKNDIPSAVQGASHAGIFLTGEGARPSSQLYLNIPAEQPQFGLRGVRTHRYKLILTAHKDVPLKQVLYDLKSDPYELTNIANDHPDIVNGLIQDELKSWLKKANDPWISNL